MAPILPRLNRDDLRRLLLRIEADTHRPGWLPDGDGLTVYVLYDTADVVTATNLYAMNSMGDPIGNVGRYAARVMMHNRLFAQAHADTGDPSHMFLRAFVMNMAFADPGEVDQHSDVPAEKFASMQALLCQPGIVGYAACYQTWHDQVSDQAGQFGAVLKDQPGARQARLVLAVDAYDRVHRVTRLRGEKPDAAMAIEMRGDISTSLRILTDLTYGRLPAPTPEGFAARYPTLDQVRSQHHHH